METPWRFELPYLPPSSRDDHGERASETQLDLARLDSTRRCEERDSLLITQIGVDTPKLVSLLTLAL